MQPMWKELRGQKQTDYPLETTFRRETSQMLKMRFEISSKRFFGEAHSRCTRPDKGLQMQRMRKDICSFVHIEDPRNDSHWREAF